MSGNLSGFDPSQHVDEGGFDPLPIGDYPVIITESSMAPTKAGNGQMLKLKLQVLNGKYQNRILWDQMLMVHPSEAAVKIAKAKLSSICRAVNVLSPNDSSELHNKPLVARVAIQKDDATRNEIKGYKERNTQAPNMIEQAFETSSAPANDASPF